MNQLQTRTVVPAKWGLPYAEERTEPEQSYIVAIAIATIIAWQTDIGTLALMPFTLLATWFHEMGHGLMAMLLGAKFEQLVIYSNGSGYALTTHAGSLWGIEQALISIAGLMGPTLAGCAMIILSRSKLATRWVLLGLGAALLVSTAIWVRSVAGWIVLPGFAAACLYLAFTQRRKVQRFAVEFLGVQGAISVWQDLGYLFSEGGMVGNELALSDTAKISDALFLPYWVWGGAITAAILAMVWCSLRFAHKHT